MMKEVTVYVPPSVEDYTGYSTFVTSGTSTSDLGSYYLPKEKGSLREVRAKEEESEGDIADRLEFYEK